MPNGRMQYAAQITAMLGPTNTGKTHYAIERMLGRASGVIGVPLRLLAREIYDKICAIKGAPACALVTGEEKIIPPHAQYFVTTTEAMPRGEIIAGRFASVCIDEVQLMAHRERGHIFTDRVLHCRGSEETLLLGADTARDLIRALVPKARHIHRERFSKLSYGGHKKFSQLPKRSVITAFSAPEIYALAELARRQFGGAALIMGGLSPRARNAQAALYQNGEVDYMIATDAIGMGLNLDASHVAFASLRKFDGTRRRYLAPNEIAQIAGRAGRFRTDGTFGTTGNCLPLDPDDIARIENHEFERLGRAEWRNAGLDFSSIEALQNSLAMPPPHRILRRIAPALDELSLERLLRLHDAGRAAKGENGVHRLWDVCQIPDFRSLGLEAHVRLLAEIIQNLSENGGRLTEDYLARNITRLDHEEGNTEILASRLAAIRTWTYLAYCGEWVSDTKRWTEEARRVEDRLSDALHEKLMQRYIDRRTSALLKGLGTKTDMTASIDENGSVETEGHTIGTLTGLWFTPDGNQEGPEAKAVNAAAVKTLGPEVDRRLIGIAASEHKLFRFNDLGQIVWNNYPVANLKPGSSMITPTAELIGGDLGKEILCTQAIERLGDFLRSEIAAQLAPLLALKEFAAAETTLPQARAFASILFENFGLIARRAHFQQLRALGDGEKAQLRGMGVHFGYFALFMPALLKQAPSRLLSLLFAFAWEKNFGGDKKPFLPANGMTSFPDDPAYSLSALNMAGFLRCGPRILRIDIAERLMRSISNSSRGRADGSFRITDRMTAETGTNLEIIEPVLESLGFSKSEIPLEGDDLYLAEQYAAFHTCRLQARAAERAKETEKEQNAASEQSVGSDDGQTVSATVPAQAPPAKFVWQLADGTNLKPELIPATRPLVIDGASHTVKVPNTITVWKRERGAKGGVTIRRDFTAPVRDPLSQARSTEGRQRKDRKNFPGGPKRKAGGKHKPQNKWSGGPKKSSAKTADPDSPFAALAALNLDKQGK